MIWIFCSFLIKSKSILQIDTSSMCWELQKMKIQQWIAYVIETAKRICFTFDNLIKKIYQINDTVVSLRKRMLIWFHSFLVYASVKERPVENLRSSQTMWTKIEEKKRRNNVSNNIHWQKKNKKRLTFLPFYLY